MLIEHNPHERQPTNTVYWILAVGLVFGWGVYLWARSADWWSISLGVSTGILLMLLADKLERQSPKP